MLRTAAIGCLIQTASRQLRQLLIRAPVNISMVTEPPRRSCHNGSKGQKEKNNAKRANSKNKVSTKTSGPAINLLERDLQDLISEQQQQQRSECAQARGSLQRRLDLLMTLGCPMTQIQDNIQVLNLTEHLILRRATLLKSLGRSPVTVELLLGVKQDSVEATQRYLTWKDGIDSALCSILRCDPQELGLLKKRHGSLNMFRCISPQDILEKGKVLSSFGVTWQEIRAFPRILNIRAWHIQERMAKLRALREEGQLKFERYPLNTVCERTRVFEDRVQRTLEGRTEIDGSAISLEKVAERLGVTAQEMRDVCLNFKKLNESSILMKIEFLRQQGITNHEILSHIYIMKYRLCAIKWAVEQSRILGQPQPSIYVLLSFLRSGRLPKKSFVSSRQRTYVAALLGVQPGQLSTLAHRPLMSADRLQMKHNYDFLTVTQGFSREDVVSCAILLAHDQESLRAYYKGMWERPEVAAYVKDEVWRDGKKVLSLLQYLIEKDMNFTSVVFHADVEYEHGSAKQDESRGGGELNNLKHGGEGAVTDPEILDLEFHELPVMKGSND